ncbi:hypothetical protein F4680DRAFT_229619 [Xylaria scruposa]|nr:hypothetical protein F4680DRAFT_229619 [Xylaria scruposa]
MTGRMRSFVCVACLVYGREFGTKVSRDRFEMHVVNGDTASRRLTMILLLVRIFLLGFFFPSLPADVPCTSLNLRSLPSAYLLAERRILGNKLDCDTSNLGLVFVSDDHHHGTP